jgi:tRNA modification GTPase
VARGEGARAVADLLILVLDGSEPLATEDRLLLTQTAGRRRIVVSNKSDLPVARSGVGGASAPGGSLRVSARTCAGMDELRLGIAGALTGDEPLREEAAISNVRHVDLVKEAHTHLCAAQQAVAGGETPEEFVLVDLQAARANLEEIGGARTNEDLLRHIFQTFCIGK